EPADHRRGDGGGQEVRGDRPVRAGRRGPELALERAQGGDDHRLRERERQGGEREDRQQAARVDVRDGGGGGRGQTGSSAGRTGGSGRGTVANRTAGSGCVWRRTRPPRRGRPPGRATLSASAVRGCG